MKKAIFATAILAGTASLGVNAQENVYLVKGGKVVAQYPVSGVDYMSFKLPEGVEAADSVVPSAVETGKNYIKYAVKTKEKDGYYGHAFFQAQTIDLLLRTYYDTTLEAVGQATLKEILKRLVANYGYLGQGDQTFTVKDGSNDGDGTDFFIPGGQDFYVATVNVTSVTDENATIGNEVNFVKLTTNTPGESGETVSVEYAGVDADGNAAYNISLGDNIKTMYALLGSKKKVDQFESVYGYDYMMFTSATQLTASDWSKYYNGKNVWEISDEDDYVMNVLAVDANGDWVKASAENHITVGQGDCPKVNVLSKEAGDGSVKVNFEITPSNVTSAYVRLMTDNDLSNELNKDKTLDQIAAEGDAEDITSTINYAGEYTFKKDNIDRGWYTLLISGTDKNGTTVTKASFHSHLTNASWEIESKTFPASTSSSAKRHSKVVPAAKPQFKADGAKKLYLSSAPGAVMQMKARKLK